MTNHPEPFQSELPISFGDGLLVAQISLKYSSSAENQQNKQEKKFSLFCIPSGRYPVERRLAALMNLPKSRSFFLFST